MPKVTIIGAGSVEFTRSILADLCAYDDQLARYRIGVDESVRRSDEPVRHTRDGTDVGGIPDAPLALHHGWRLAILPRFLGRVSPVAD